MKIRNLEELFLDGLQYALDAEKQLTQALSEMAAATSAPQLREAFENHLRETKEHASRLEQVFKRIGEQAATKPNTVAAQMRHEAREIIQNTDRSEVRDAALIVAGNQVEHYEMAVYGSLRAFAQLLGHDDAAGILQKTLDEEKRADAKLTELGDSEINIQALHKSAAAMAAAG